LIELLTVVGIVGLLTAILLPSLARGRDQAKRAGAGATIAAVETGLEMFHADFRKYPPSRRNIDPVVDFPSDRVVSLMEGAHLLVRGLLGHDLRGLDAEWISFSRKEETTMDILAGKPRKGPYLNPSMVLPDIHPRFKDTTGWESRRSGRPVVVDQGYRFPLLYYRARLRAAEPFCMSGNGEAQQGVYPDRPGVYCLFDNQAITGRWDGNVQNSLPGWDFAGTGTELHPIAAFGTLTPAAINETSPVISRGKTFVGVLHDENALEAASTIKPVNPARYALIAPGRDGLYGTNDDVTNFR
jgi:hypothetical protein